jgi:ELMO domain-containing protein
MGMLGLYNLIAFADCCGLDAGRVLQESRDGGLRWFSFAITGINLSADLLRLTRERVLDEYYARHGATIPAFQALYCQSTMHGRGGHKG